MEARPSPPQGSEGESADRDPLLGNEYLIGSSDRRRGPHCLFTFLSINAVIAAQLTPDKLPHAIYDTPPSRMVVSRHGIFQNVQPEPYLSLNEVANMKLDPRMNRLSIYWRPIFGEQIFPLPKLPERRKKRTQSGRKGLSTQLSMTRDGNSEVGKGKGARRDDRGFDKYRKLPSVAAHHPWCARTDARAESGDWGMEYEFDRYRELPSIVAHGAWCARTRTGDDEDGDRGGGYRFERYRELPSVVAHGAWCATTRTEDDEDVEDGERWGRYRFDKYSELPSVVAHGAWCARTEDGDDKETEEEDDA